MLSDDFDPKMTDIKAEIQQLQVDVTLILAPALVKLFIPPIMPLVVLDLLADDAPALAFEKRTQSGNGIYETSMRWAHKREHRELEAARHASLLDEQLR